MRGPNWVPGTMLTFQGGWHPAEVGGTRAHTGPDYDHRTANAAGRHSANRPRHKLALSRDENAWSTNHAAQHHSPRASASSQPGTGGVANEREAETKHLKHSPQPMTVLNVSCSKRKESGVHFSRPSERCTNTCLDNYCLPINDKSETNPPVGIDVSFSQLLENEQ